MSVAAGHDPDPSPSYAVARQRNLRRTLESHGGVLTRERLYEAAHADLFEAGTER
jgi:hypothetical protein